MTLFLQTFKSFLSQILQNSKSVYFFSAGMTLVRHWINSLVIVYVLLSLLSLEAVLSPWRAVLDDTNTASLSGILTFNITIGEQAKELQDVLL